MRRLHTNNDGGYIALLAVLILGAAASAIAFGLLLTGTDSQRSALVSQQSAQARQLAHSCIEEALQVINLNNSFTGTNSLSLGQGSCTYTVNTSGSSTRVVDAAATVSNISRKVKAHATIGTASISITSWQEVADM